MLNLPKNIYLISLAMAMCFCSSTLMILVSGLLGSKMAPTAQLATLPMATLIIGTALSTIPASMIMRKIGRKPGFLISIIVAMIGNALAFFATLHAHFNLLILATLCFGFNLAFVQQGRFIILENSDNKEQQANGLTLALLASLLAGFIGPQLGNLGKDLIETPHGYAGSFALLFIILLAALCTMLTYQEVNNTAEEHPAPERPLFAIIKQPIFLISAGSAAIGYAVMSLIMTATPISMIEMSGLTVQNATMVIQTHITAMFLPSIITGVLLKKGYKLSLLFVGIFCYLIVTAIALSGHQVMHYWWALLLLGIGWNFLFMSSTALLPESYQDNERFKAQAANEFGVFSFQAIAAFSAGWLFFKHQWQGVILVGLIVTIAWLICLCLLSILRKSGYQENIV